MRFTLAIQDEPGVLDMRKDDSISRTPLVAPRDSFTTEQLLERL